MLYISAHFVTFIRKSIFLREIDKMTKYRIWIFFSNCGFSNCFNVKVLFKIWIFSIKIQKYDFLWENVLIYAPKIEPKKPLHFLLFLAWKSKVLLKLKFCSLKLDCFMKKCFDFNAKNRTKNPELLLALLAWKFKHDCCRFFSNTLSVKQIIEFWL